MDELFGITTVDEDRFNLEGMGGKRLLDIAELRRVQEELKDVFILSGRTNTQLLRRMKGVMEAGSDVSGR